MSQDFKLQLIVCDGDVTAQHVISMLDSTIPENYDLKISQIGGVLDEMRFYGIYTVPCLIRKDSSPPKFIVGDLKNLQATEISEFLK